MTMESYETAYRVLKNVFVFLIYCVIFILLSFGAKRAYQFGYGIFADEPAGSLYIRDYPITITETMTDSEVAELLAEKGLIEDKDRFLIKKKVFYSKEKFVPGNYVLNNTMKMSEIMKSLISGSVTAEETEEEE